MSIFKNLFKKESDAVASTPNELNINWVALTKIEQLEDIKETSKIKTVLIFKHSTRCGISKMVLKQFEQLFTDEHKSLEVYFLDLLAFRNLSDAIAKEFNIQHQSPQIIAVKNEQAVFSAAHYDITQIKLSRFL